MFFARFVCCELLNLVNCGLQVVVIDRLLGGEFSTYGLQAARLATLPDEERCRIALLFAVISCTFRSDPMATVFPKVTKCTFHNFGSSGTVQR